MIEKTYRYCETIGQVDFNVSQILKRRGHMNVDDYLDNPIRITLGCLQSILKIPQVAQQFEIIEHDNKPYMLPKYRGFRLMPLYFERA